MGSGTWEVFIFVMTEPRRAGKEGTMRSLWMRFWADDSGQDLAEYALLIALIAITVMLALPPVGAAIARVFTNVAGALDGAGGGTGTTPPPAN